MKILLTENYPEIKKEYLDYLKTNNELFYIEDNFSNNEIESAIIRSNTKIDSDFLDKYTSLKYIARVGVGLDKIDLEECKSRNIKVLNTPFANMDSVADLVLTWILNLSRNINLWFSGLENRFSYMWNEMWTKSVWIIGFWNIWKKVRERLLGFWVKQFYVFDPFLKKEDVEKNKYCKFIEDKNEVFKLSDIITFHIPLFPATKDFLWTEEIKLLKKDVTIVNTSRGWIINELELIKFLKKNSASSFFADVWEEEPQNPKKELLELKNTLITPHIWAMTRQSEEKMHFFKELI
jgi:phosphoglycerate dehydrogenase-like enzyme